MLQGHHPGRQMTMGKHDATPAHGQDFVAAAAAGVPTCDDQLQTGLSKCLKPKPVRKGNSTPAKVRGHAKTLRTRLQHQVMAP